MDLNVRAAARLLCSTEEHIYELIASGALPHYIVHDEPRFNRVEILELATRRKLKVATELFEDERRPVNGSRLKLSRLLAAGGIHRDLVGADAPALLGSLARTLTLPPGLSPDEVVALITAERGLIPVGGGIAIPHARSPIALGDVPLLALGFAAAPLAMGAHDGRPVHALFAVVSPSIRVHLDILSKLAIALLDPPFHALVDRRAPDVELLDRLRALEAEAGDGAAL